MKYFATKDPSAFLLSDVQRCEGETILVAPCADFDAYQALPRVLLFEGKQFGLTGWNSDLGTACWKSSHSNLIAHLPNANREKESIQFNNPWEDEEAAERFGI